MLIILSKLSKSVRTFLLRILNYPKYLIQKNNIYIVYTMGKVGSSTVYSTLKSEFPFNAIFHVHFLSDNALNYWRSSDIKENFEVGKSVREYIKSHPTKKIKVITLVREPIARNVSDFFQNHAKISGKPQPGILPKLLDDFSKLDYSYTTLWFEKEFNNYLEFDIYSIPFDKAKGYKSYHHNGIEIMVIRLEDLSSCFNMALKNITGYNFTKLTNSNEAVDKVEAEVYKSFVKEYNPTKEEINMFYNSKYTRHFYTEEEIQRFKQKWVK